MGITRQWSKRVKQLKTKQNKNPTLKLEQYNRETVFQEQVYNKEMFIFFSQIELTMYKQNSRQYTLRRKGYMQKDGLKYERRNSE